MSFEELKVGEIGGGLRVRESENAVWLEIFREMNNYLGAKIVVGGIGDDDVKSIWRMKLFSGLNYNGCGLFDGVEVLIDDLGDFRGFF